ncbi:carbohydrate ABC transporter permease [Thermoanaerobacter sp. A7A]|uniref:carbohydrate ABC transporter permease n=1 Tax=Thermoanaerobacter sp. A7A TaxID=1350366 RepID=UPI0004168300|nr:carbohydrate ABC transporter permease [Thermoanaerobacter sp. A7A]
MRSNWKIYLLYFTHIIIALLLIFPLLFAIISSFRPLDDVFRYVSPVTWKTFIPLNFTLQAYISLFMERNFGSVILNTFFVSIVTVVFGIFINSMAAFAFAKFEFKGKRLLFFIVLLTFMLPFEIISIPLYNIVNRLGWIDSYYALIVPSVANGMVIFLFRQFFLDIPDSLLESARIDGATWFWIYFRIIMPLSKPVTVSAALLIFIYQWESFLWPLIATRTEKYRVIQIAISYLTTEFGTYWNEIFAATIVAVIVPVLLLLFLQRYFVQGITSTGMKEG